MRNHRHDVVESAMAVLDAYGLADLSMRRLAADLGVRPAALYHHFASKQVLLAAVADELLARGSAPRSPRPLGRGARGGLHGPARGDAGLPRRCRAGRHRAGLRAGRTGAVRRAASTCWAVPDLPAGTVEVGARTLLHFVLGHTADEQTHLQAGSAGAIEDAPREESGFGTGLGLITDGLRARRAGGRTARAQAAGALSR